ncbi:hypothetical protein L7F22_042949 [Adiantum nelumboides]|nr:hypothetical protein [Adiantum nelumboides]
MRRRDYAYELTATFYHSSSHCGFYLRQVHGFSTRDPLLDQGFPTEKSSLAKILCVCCKEKSVDKGQCLHTFAVFLGLDSDATIATTILSLYGKCGALDDAFKTFEGLHDKDVISWNAIISADAKHGHGADCLHLFDEMHQMCVLADKFTMVGMLSACAALEDIKAGQYIHAQLVIEGDQREVILNTALVHMYSKCKNINYARNVFDKMEHHDMVSWNTMISGYAQLGYVDNAFHLFNEMSYKGMLPNTVTFIVVLNACAALPDVHAFHLWLVEAGFKLDVVLGSALVNIYSTYSCLRDAHKVFGSLLERNVITWNSLMAGYTQENSSEEALKLFYTMLDGSVNPDRTTWSIVFDTCADLDSLAVGEWMYNQVIIIGLDYDNIVVASAMKLYSKFCCVDISQLLFRRVIHKDFLLWNTMIMLCSQHRLFCEACELLLKMHELGMVPDRQMLVDLLIACAKYAALSEGRFIHFIAVLLDIHTDPLVTNALINMYGDCSSLEDALCAFESLSEKTRLVLTSIIGAYAHSGNDAHAIYLYKKMCGDNVLFDKVTLLKLLNACSKQEYLTDGQNMHKDITIRGFDLDCMIANALIDMYGKCGAFLNAKRMFDHMVNRDVVSWNIMIKVYALHKKVTEVFQCFSQMEKEQVAPDEITYVSILSACTWNDTFLGLKLVYACIVISGFAEVPTIVASLIHSYGSLGTLVDTLYLFDKSPVRNTVTWSSMINVHAEQGRTEEALQLFVQMQNEGVLAEKAAYLCAFNTFNDSKSLLCGKHLHTCIISLGFSHDILVNTALISLYGRCSSLEDACMVFYGMPEKDEVSWSAFVCSSSENGVSAQALQLLERMLEEALLPNLTVFLNFLIAYTEHRALTDGIRLHARLLCSSWISNLRITNAILNMYGEFGSKVDLERHYFKMQEHDVVSCNIVIKSYMHLRCLQDALQSFLQMVVEGFLPDTITLANIFEICGELCAYFQGKLVHISVLSGGVSHGAVNNAAISMYSKCGHLQEALIAFNLLSERNVASWNSIISAYCHWEVNNKALEIFSTMLLEVTPDVTTLVIVLGACTSEDALTNGRLLHYFSASLELEDEVMVGNSLISMYGRCWSPSDAKRVFERLSAKTTATWNAMLTSGVLQGPTNGHSIENMQRNRVSPNEITFASALDFCVNNNSIVGGQLLHMHILFCGFELDGSIVTSLVNLYGKSGMLMDARCVFDRAIIKSLFTWTAMIAAYACYGLCREALLLLQQMELERVVVDNIAFVSVLSSCSHSGSRERGEHLFVEMFLNKMVELEHADCVIDLYCRIGQLTEAENITWSMPFQPSALSWTALVCACQTVGDVDRACCAVAHITELNIRNIAGF